MASIKEAILRNCLLYTNGGTQCKIEEHCGDFLLTYPDNIVRRSRRGASGALYIPMQNGGEIKVDMSKLLAA